MVEHVSPRRVALGVRLREVRATRYRSGSAMARALQWQQTKVSKIELGRQLPSESEVRAWVSAVDGGTDDIADLLDLLGRARVDYRAWNDVWRSPGAIVAAQDDIAEIDARATRIAEYQPAMVPGLAQTPAYARDVLTVAAGSVLLGAGTDEIDARIAAQLRRQQVLYTPGKTVQLVMGEAALHTRFGDRDTLAGQLDRLVVLAGLGNLEIAIVPFDTPSPLLPLAGFAINDSTVVWVETLAGEQRLDDAEQVKAYADALEAARAVAAVGSKAVDLIRKVRP